jgi:predicted DNA binding CopG/RHH family protein
MNRSKRVPQIKLRVPKFKNETEEAAWWDAHPEIITKAFEHALKQRPKHPPTKTVTIRLAVEDVVRARRLATRKGLGYQTLVKTLLHEAIEREERA